MSDNYGAYCKKCQVRSPACCGLCTVCVSELEDRVKQLNKALWKLSGRAARLEFGEHKHIDKLQTAVYAEALQEEEVSDVL